MKRGKPGVTEAGQRQSSLLDLPDTALALVVQHSKPAAQPLLGLARGCRDAVLSHSRRISLKITSNESVSVARTARLLNRACCTAPVGLHLDLDLSGHEDVLAPLLKAALEQPAGWPNVHKVKVCLDTSSYVHLICPAMPALHLLELALQKWDLGDGGFFSSLQLCTQLTALHLKGFVVSESIAMVAAAALARLPNLRELGLEANRISPVCPSALVKHLTALTSLRLHNNSSAGSSDPLYTAAARNPGLLSFSVYKEDLNENSSAPAAQVQQLLETCPSLTHLGFEDTRVQQDALVAILTYGTNITSLSASGIEPSSSIAGREVSWRKLVVTGHSYPSTQHLADLPLQSVTSLQLSSSPNAFLGLLELPTSSVPTAQLPGLLLQATTNLAKCPAWRSEPSSQLALRGDARYANDGVPATTRLSDEQRLQLFHALAPLGGPHVKIFTLSIRGCNVKLGRAEVTAVAQSLGKGLMTLRLNHVMLSAGFWAALDDALPSLGTLALLEQVECCPAEVGLFCGKRSTDRRLLLQMAPVTYQLCGGDALRQGLRAQNVTHIRLVKLKLKQQQQQQG